MASICSLVLQVFFLHSDASRSSWRAASGLDHFVMKALFQTAVIGKRCPTQSATITTKALYEATRRKCKERVFIGVPSSFNTSNSTNRTDQFLS